MRHKWKVPFFMLMMIVSCLVLAPNVSAASATLSIETIDQEIKVGDEFTVIVKVRGDSLLGDIDTYFNYSSDKMKYVSGPESVSEDGGSLSIYELISEKELKTRSYQIKFKALKEGEAKFYVDKQRECFIYDKEGSRMSVKSNQLSTKIRGKNAKSSNNLLDSISIKEGVLEQEFNADIFHYKMTVGYNISKLTITATPQDDKAKVSISGNGPLSLGDNKVTIKVTAQSGDSCDYTIMVNRLTKEETLNPEEPIVTETEEPKPTKTPEPEKEEKPFNVYQTDGITCIETKQKYQIASFEDLTLIPEGYEKTKIRLDGVSVPAYAVTQDIKDEFVLVYLKNEAGEIGFYQYDRKDKTFQRYTGKLVNQTTEHTTVMTKDEYRTNIEFLFIVIAVMAAIILLLLVAIVRILMKKKGMKNY